MNEVVEQRIAIRLLEARATGCSWGFYLRRSAAFYFIMSGAIAVLALMYVIEPNQLTWSAACLFIGFFGGAILRDIGLFRLTRSRWPFNEKVTDWAKVQQIAEG